MKIVIPGGSGFLGRTLARYFGALGWQVTCLTRSNNQVPNIRTCNWDGKTLGPWTQELESANLVVNLAGRSVNCRYTPRNRQEMMDSRVNATHVIGEAIQQCKHPPEVWMNSSTATIYKHRFDSPNNEQTGIIGSHPDAKDQYSVEVAQAWEAAFESITLSDTRKITLRTAMVFGSEPGGVYEVLRRLVRLRLGGKMGNGKQLVSWIDSHDYCKSIEFLFYNQNSVGIYNQCAPNPLTNKEMMRTLREVHSVKLGLPAKRWMLELGALMMRTETELILKSRNVIPSRLLAEGFNFRFGKLRDAIRELESLVP